MKLKLIFALPSLVLSFFIRIYQCMISPDHSFIGRIFYPFGCCKFYPSCSEYGYQSIKKYGLLKGSLKTIWRVLRCNPWNKGGVDAP
ncbi:MAG: membrane protein insertion efficiency factor YidD [Patescibacteria group bacterium]|nr:membrane protein insertion efficiency factor YidD [Patescibacteria group bacterium]